MKLDDFVYPEYIKEELAYSGTYKHIQRYIAKDIFNHNEENVNSDVKENRTIWSLWLQGEKNAPRIIRKCIDSVKKNVPKDYDVLVLDENSITDYITLPEYINEKYKLGCITKTHYSDIVRTELLYRYGGCWIDASVFCSDSVPELLLDCPMFFFRSSPMDHPIHKGSTWWISSEVGNRLICGTRNILRNYWKEETALMNYFLIHVIISELVDSDSVCKTLYNAMPVYSNHLPHILYSKFNEEYSEREWERIKSSTVVNKLSYKRRFILGDHDSFFQAFMDGRLENTGDQV